MQGQELRSERAPGQQHLSRHRACCSEPGLWVSASVSLFSLIKHFPAVLPRALRSNEQLIFVKSFEAEWC